jgi:EEF1A lysine methyltransferase 4
MDIIEPNEIVEESFNCVIDKGTFDCIACAEDGLQKKIEQMLENIYRILSPGGSYICISRGPPETRLVYLHSQTSRVKWKVETLKIPKKALGQASRVPGIDVVNGQL